MKTRIRYIIIGIVILLAGYLIGRWTTGEPEATGHDHEMATDEAKDQVWTCSMHPQIRQPEPGSCPICGMDLIPVSEEGDDEENMNVIKLSASAVRLADVQTTKASLVEPVKEILLQGKVAADERRVYSQTAHFTGRIEALNVNFTGEYVRKGQVIARIYSPELYTAQEELLEAIKYRESNPVMFESAKTKLKQWKLDSQQIQEIISSGKVIENFPVKADVSGYVLEKNVNLLDHVMEGDPMYQVANLSSVWVLFDAYESDLPWVKKGGEIEFTVHSVPGKTFAGKIRYIDPALDPETRTVSVRVQVPNPDYQLKPGMFARGIMFSKLSDDQLLVVPKSSVMWTGQRSIVYVKQPGTDFKFQLREVVLGPSLGRAYVIEEGLNEGEEIVTHGTFTVDAAAQLAGKQSMMNEAMEVRPMSHDHAAIENMDQPDKTELKTATSNVPDNFKKMLEEVYDSYLDLKNALVESDVQQSGKAAENVLNSLENVDMSLVKGEDHMYWMDQLNTMRDAAKSISGSNQLEEQRKAFSSLTSGLVKSIRYFGLKNVTVYYQYCPMAFDFKGDYWLSSEEAIRNPYFGDEMLTCGSVEEIFEF